MEPFDASVANRTRVATQPPPARMSYPDGSLPWFYLADATCLCQQPTYKLVDAVLAADVADMLTTKTAHSGDPYPPLIEHVKTTVASDGRFDNQPNNWPKRAEHPWPQRFVLGIHEMPDGVPGSEVILGPDKVVLPWPFPSDADKRLQKAAANEGLSFPQVKPVSPGQGGGGTDVFDPATDVYLDALMYAVDHLLTEDRGWLGSAGEGASTNQRHVREVIMDGVRSNCSGRVAADPDYVTLPERMWFTIDPDRITDQTYFTVLEDGAGASMLHVVMGKTEREEVQKMEVWSCRDQD